MLARSGGGKVVRGPSGDDEVQMAVSTILVAILVLKEAIGGYVTLSQIYEGIWLLLHCHDMAKPASIQLWHTICSAA